MYRGSPKQVGRGGEKKKWPPATHLPQANMRDSRGKKENGVIEHLKVRNERAKKLRMS